MLVALRRYYLPTFFVYTAGLTLKLGFDYLVYDVVLASPIPQTLLSLFGLAVGLSLLIGGIYHGCDAFIRPGRNRKTLRKLADLDLLEINPYLDEENGCLSGSYQSYFLTIFPYADVNKGEGVRINAFVEPEEEERPIDEKLKQSYEFYTNQEEGLCWVTAYVAAHMITGKLDNEQVRSAIRQLIHDLMEAGLKPQVFEGNATD